MVTAINLLWLGMLLLLTEHITVPVSSQRTLCQVLDGGVTDCSNKGLTLVPRNLPSTTKIL